MVILIIHIIIKSICLMINCHGKSSVEVGNRIDLRLKNGKCFRWNFNKINRRNKMNRMNRFIKVIIIRNMFKEVIYEENKN